MIISILYLYKVNHFIFNTMFSNIRFSSLWGGVTGLCFSLFYGPTSIKMISHPDYADFSDMLNFLLGLIITIISIVLFIRDKKKNRSVSNYQTNIRRYTHYLLGWGSFTFFTWISMHFQFDLNIFVSLLSTTINLTILCIITIIHKKSSKNLSHIR